MASAFWIITDDDGAVRIINGDLIRVVDEMRPDHMRIHFDNDHVLELKGRAASEAIDFLQRLSYLTNRQTADLRQMVSAKPQ
jgi:hypothetical protein